MATPSASNNDEIFAPIVFQCAACRRIVGDTFAWIASEEPLKAVIVHGSSGDTAVAEPILHVAEGPDKGCSYQEVRCTCGATVGKKYVSTLSEWDHLRNNIALDSNALTSYQLGSAGSPPEDVASLPSTKELLETNQKMLVMIMTHEERIQALEERLAGNAASS